MLFLISKKNKIRPHRPYLNISENGNICMLCILLDPVSEDSKTPLSIKYEPSTVAPDPSPNKNDAVELVQLSKTNCASCILCVMERK